MPESFSLPIPNSGPASIFVFSHPNHEIAVYGMIQRLDPWMIYLTDGGGEHRVSQTKSGLQMIDRLDKAIFLDHSEASFYQGLVDRDTAFFSQVADEIREAFPGQPPSAVFMDAIEFYNPVHDLAVPLVFRAFQDCDEVPKFEIPLVHQVPEDGPDGAKGYLIQRFPSKLAKEAQVFGLTQEELDRKIEARDTIYTLLADQLGSTLSNLSAAHLGREFTGPAPASGAREAGESFALRYDSRAQKLLEEGRIEKPITFREHYLSLTESLLPN